MTPASFNSLSSSVSCFFFPNSDEALNKREDREGDLPRVSVGVVVVKVVSDFDRPPNSVFRVDLLFVVGVDAVEEDVVVVMIGSEAGVLAIEAFPEESEL